ncbi:helix-turn-helix domain-containing protein [Enterobacter sp.]|uniref:helix-turn-helix domain-containing protein n=1 Tax=Enterobacter sp. TaxID=42895 RepID=UPI00296F8FFF|nr:helix-turn-helix domain-containing protein [Enterobacter sp.]
MMMNDVINQANSLASITPLLGGNTTEKDYREALQLVEHLLETDEDNVLVDILSRKIEEYEDNAPQFAQFNERIASLPGGVAVLRVLIDQHGLTLSDFENEIGKKSMVSLILNGKRSLTLEHVRKLSARFGISPALFF